MTSPQISSNYKSNFCQVNITPLTIQFAQIVNPSLLLC